MADSNEKVKKKGGEGGSERKRQNRKRDQGSLRKAPQAPKRFKSSYIFFFTATQQKIKDELGQGSTVTDVSKRSAEMWRNLPAEERAYWDDVANKDKQRYINEKAAYTGPWQVPWKRVKKDPSAPKRPMSAFLYFSQERRRAIKDKNPGMLNTEVSRILGEMWRNAKEEERKPYIEHEIKERDIYKVKIAKWREEHEAKLEAQKKEQEERIASMAQQQPMMAAPYDQGQQQHMAPMATPYGHPNMMMQHGMQQPYMGAPHGGPAMGMPYNYMGGPMVYAPYSHAGPVPPGGAQRHVVLGPSGMPQHPHAYPQQMPMNQPPMEYQQQGMDRQQQQEQQQHQHIPPAQQEYQQVENGPAPPPGQDYSPNRMPQAGIEESEENTVKLEATL